jgi:hypothetical protein
MKNLIYLLSFVLLGVSCSKSPGVGGKATIKGKVEAIYVKKGSFDTLEVGAVPEHRVYIVYGDGAAQDDDYRTSPDGSYKFEFLNPGDYKIYSFSESKLNASGLMEVSYKVNVGKKETEVIVPTISIIQYVK